MMGSERLNGLCLMNFHLDKVPDADTVRDRYLALNDRVIDCGKISNTDFLFQIFTCLNIWDLHCVS